MILRRKSFRNGNQYKSQKIYGPRIITLSIEGACWIYKGTYKGRFNGTHYPVVWNYKSGTCKQLHVLIYEAVYGPIHNLIHHTCQNILCINPAHLADMTQSSHQKEHRKLRLAERPL